MYVDPSGHMPEWLKIFLDILFLAIAFLFGLLVGIFVTAMAGPVIGFAAGVLTFGAFNNITNAIYYNNISDGKSGLDNKSYNSGYINRWDRLDYTKEQTGKSQYSLTLQCIIVNIAFICMDGLLHLNIIKLIFLFYLILLKILHKLILKSEKEIQDGMLTWVLQFLNY